MLEKTSHRALIFNFLEKIDHGEKVILLLSTSNVINDPRVICIPEEKIPVDLLDHFLVGIDVVLYGDSNAAPVLAYAEVPMVYLGNNPDSDPVVRAGGASYTNLEGLLGFLEIPMPIPREFIEEECGVKKNWQEELLLYLNLKPGSNSNSDNLSD